jgi:negative regulator of sigma-B (phosphoserine phosphatase)
MIAIEWGWAGSALEDESGDLHVVVPVHGGAMVALIDGLGHGQEAADAARAAVPVIEAHAADPVALVIERCHDALRGTRGAAMTIASLSTADSLSWAGVGNVDAVVLRRDGRPGAGIAVRGGVVGYQLPPLRTATVDIVPGDVLILATDGVRAGFIEGVVADGAPQDIADSILTRWARGSDDARVVVARYLGGPR